MEFRHLIIPILLQFFIKIINCESQTCEFVTEKKFVNSEDGPEREFYACRIHNAILLNSTIPVTTIMSGINANQAVEMVIYSQKSHVTFIPNSLFTDFTNVTYLWVEPKNKFKNMKLHNIEAENLTTLVVEGNEIRKLGPHCFGWAKNLEIINLRHNRIEIINKLAFDDLSKIKRIYLHGNEIKNVFENTFSNIRTLVVLDLRNNACMNKTIIIKDFKKQNIDLEIQDHCAYEEAIHTLLDFTKTMDAKLESEIMLLMNNLTQLEKNWNTRGDKSLQDQVNGMALEIMDLKKNYSSDQNRTNKIFYGLFLIIILFMLFFMYALTRLLKDKFCVRSNKYESTQTMNTIAGELHI